MKSAHQEGTSTVGLHSDEVLSITLMETDCIRVGARDWEARSQCSTGTEHLFYKVERVLEMMVVI